jgi:hypothetical protein
VRIALDRVGPLHLGAEAGRIVAVHDVPHHVVCMLDDGARLLLRLLVVSGGNALQDMKGERTISS